MGGNGSHFGAFLFPPFFLEVTNFRTGPLRKQFASKYPVEKWGKIEVSEKLDSSGPWCVCVCVRAGGGGIEDEKACQLVHLGVHTGLSFQGEIVSIACPQTVGKFVCLVEAGLLCLSKWLLLPIGIPSLPACFTFSHSQDSKVCRMFTIVDVGNTGNTGAPITELHIGGVQHF